jgi:hypothetical protein
MLAVDDSQITKGPNIIRSDGTCHDEPAARMDDYVLRGQEVNRCVPRVT